MPLLLYTQKMEMGKLYTTLKTWLDNFNKSHEAKEGVKLNYLI
jgi:hypothetical protein